MRHVDFSPLYRSTVGFDRLFTMLDSLAQPETAQTYPPYNIERTGEDSYRISMAVAGFSETDIAIEAHRNVLSIKGERKDEGNGEGSEVLYRGIAARAFERRFQLADHVEVTGANLKNGLLHIDLKRSVPEELKKRFGETFAQIVSLTNTLQHRIDGINDANKEAAGTHDKVAKSYHSQVDKPTSDISSLVGSIATLFEITGTNGETAADTLNRGEDLAGEHAQSWTPGEHKT